MDWNNYKGQGDDDPWASVGEDYGLTSEPSLEFWRDREYLIAEATRQGRQDLAYKADGAMCPSDLGPIATALGL